MASATSRGTRCGPLVEGPVVRVRCMAACAVLPTNQRAFSPGNTFLARGGRVRDGNTFMYPQIAFSGRPLYPICGKGYMIS